MFNDKAIPHLVQMLNGYQSKSNIRINKELTEIGIKLKEIQNQINNIVKAIENGFFQESFKNWSKRNSCWEYPIKQLSIKDAAIEITEDSLMKMFKMFKQFVTEKNIPECKKFIDSYVEKVIVYKDHLEVSFNAVFSFEQENNIYSF
ncbi:MAG: hypothetical protein NHB14_17680 [Desulfosporosinus sp.]|nr:hypothetical protein [Desulfosporosinus sp.]